MANYQKKSNQYFKLLQRIMGEKIIPQSKFAKVFLKQLLKFFLLTLVLPALDDKEKLHELVQEFRIGNSVVYKDGKNNINKIQPYRILF